MPSRTPSGRKDREKIVGFIPHGRGEFEMGGTYPEYVSMELTIGKEAWRSQKDEDYLSIRATEGYIMSEHELDKVHDDYIANLDVEDEYGYLADEAHKTGTSRADFLEGLKEDLDNEWPYPWELNGDLGEHRVGSQYYFGTGHTWGGADLLNDAVHSIPKDDFEFILRMRKWNGKPTKDIPPTDLERLKAIFSDIDNSEQIAVGLRRWAKRRRKPGQQRLTAFRRPHPTVPVRTHLRRTR